MKNLKNWLATHGLATWLMVAVAVVAPVMYSLSFIQSVWDPYGGAKNLPVAVVNKDQATGYQGHTLKVGDQTVQQLKQNHQLKWEFVSASQAKEGMRDHRYYTVVTIPRNFSRNAATVMSKHPQKMTLHYQTNDSKNYLAETMSEIGMDKLNTQIRAAVTKAYAQAMFSQLKVLGKGMNKAANGAQQLSNGMVTLQDGTNRYFAGVSQVNQGTQTLKMGVAPLAAGAQQLAAGSQTLANGIGAYTGAVGQLSAGLYQLMANSGQLNGGAQTLTNGLSTLSSNSGQLRAGAQALDNGTKQLNAAVSQSMGHLNTQGIMATMDQAQQLQNSLGTLQQGLQQAQSALSGLNQSAQKLGAAGNALNGAASQLGQLSGVAEKDADIARQAAQLAQTTSDNNAKGALQSIAREAQGNAQTISGMSGTLRQLGALKDSLGQMQSQLGQLSSMQGVLNNAGTTLHQANQLLNQLNGFRGTITGLTGTASQLQAATGKLAAGAGQLNNGLNAYSHGVDSAAAGSKTLSNGVGAFTAGVNQAGNGAAQLNSNSGKLNAGASQLAGALGQLNGKVPALVGGVNQLAAGTQQLVDNSPAIEQGIVKLNNGAGQLATALGNGATMVKKQQPGKRTAGMFAAPAQLSHSHYSRVPNYGHALAPFIMATGLFIGVLIFTLEFPSSRILAAGRNRLDMTLHELRTAIITSVLMVLVQNLVLMATGLQVEHAGELFVIGISYTLAQMAIMQCFTIAFGRFGTIFGLILFVAQLGGAGGMFPLEVTNRFFNVINPFLPMTYAVNGFREAVTGGFSTGFANSNVMILWLYVLVFYLIMFMIANPLKLRWQSLRGQQKTAAVK
ncbi:YhgE/Pip domain-containing protein [Limosilactobacillus secaliphilus]|uniref:ABC-2 type transporter transmembrane domain-containing protein n=1 Tax=Limosilactobacillus secaliphilus TaxID=396268 RepID=A0A0R2I9I3_9LACO|nr:YhgE/Pip domain-containing protein [Limosilactobacillus secaliphilus]KRN59301.1 hypothetical protein IV45_GL001450 [Limosilactobacillus secaliphilus]